MSRKFPRLPGIHCPHCNQRMIVRGSERLTDTVRELRMSCPNDDCAASFVAQLSLIRQIRASDQPNPAVRLPFGLVRRKAANDGHPLPDNDTGPTDDNGLGAAIAAIMTT